MDERQRSLHDPEILRVMVRRLHEGMYVTTRTGVIVDANAAFLNMLGVASLEELRGVRAADLLVDPSVREREIELLDKLGSVRDFELQIRRPDGQVRTVIDSAFTLPNREGEELMYGGILVDITDRKRLEQQLLEQSVRDPLTGCFNRRYLSEFEASMGARTWGCIVLDVDRFKEYNDRFGHKVGDDVLTRVARFLVRQTRAEEGLVRLGGDEFVVVVGGADAQSLERTATRLQQIGARELPISFSLGWAARQEGEPLERTINRADHRLLKVRSEQRTYEHERRRM